MAPLFMDGTGAALGGNAQRAVRGPSPREKAGSGPARQVELDLAHPFVSGAPFLR